MLETLARHWGLMNAMARKAGVDLGHEYIHGKLRRSALRGAVFSCTRCGSVTACEAFLAGEDGAAELPDYCRNRSLILALKPTAH